MDDRNADPRSALERLVEESVRDTIATARRLEPDRTGPLTVVVELSPGFASEAGMVREQRQVVNVP